MSKNCIVLSQGPVPTPEHNKVEGGGLRCWGIAKGILANNSDVNVTVAYHKNYKLDNFTKEYQGIKLDIWDDSILAELIADFDTVIVSYCMGGLSTGVVDHIRPDQQLILDCYVPIYAEVSARNSDSIDSEYAWYMEEVPRWSHVLKRGDVFLCANQAQRDYYEGVLSALGRINPVTYEDTSQILIVPYGIYRDKPVAKTKPINKRLGSNVRKILWFGGIYPWFDLKQLVDAVNILNNENIPTKLMIVGAKNPFNDHPDFVSRADELEAYTKADSKLQKLVAFKNWIRFDERADWYLDSDVVVILNREGPENKLSWRTRLVDFMWADLPIMTNGGDPLGEILIQSGAAIRLDRLDAKTMAANLHDFLESDEKLDALRKNLAKVRKNYYWDVVTHELTRVIIGHKKAADTEKFGAVDKIIAKANSRARAKHMTQKVKMLPRYAQKYGFKNTYIAIRMTGESGVKRVIGRAESRNPAVVCIAHQLDLSGAPYIFIDVLQAFRHKYPKMPIEFHTFNPTHKDNIIALNKIGIKPQLHLSKDIGISFQKGDVIVLNTVAHSPILKHSIYAALENNIANKLIWYIHEDEPQLQFASSEQKRVKKLLDKGLIEMFVISSHASKNYQQFFDNNKFIHKQLYRFSVDKKYQNILSANDFDTLHFVLPGTMGDGRKGQLPIFYALTEYKKRFYDLDPESYRDFQLLYIGAENDFLSTQILNHSKKALGEHFKYTPKVSRQKVLELLQKSNITICYSLRECLPLFVFEGMIAGHPILRNESSGLEEQLVDGKNGFLLESKNFEQVIETFEHVLNKKTTSNQTLASMSKTGHAMAAGFEKYDYVELLTAIYRSFKTY